METRTTSLLGFIEALPADVPRIVFTPSVKAAVDSIELESVTSSYGKTIVFTWDNAPRIDDAISHTVKGLAELVLEHWPNWLGQVALSRAKCLAIVVENPELALSKASSVKQMILINLFFTTLQSDDNSTETEKAA